MKRTNTKELITNEAFKQFAENGFDSASIRTIAKRVGIRESAIYNHFSSKTAILEEIFVSKVNRDLGVELLTDDLLNMIGNPKKFLSKFVSKLFAMWKTENEQLLFYLLIKEATSKRVNSYTLFDYMADFTKLWTFIFEQMIAFGTISGKSASLMANEFVTPLFFQRMKYYTAENSPERKKIKKEIDSHVEFFVDIISK